LHNTSIGYFPRQPPNFAVKAAAVIGFPLLAWFSPGKSKICLFHARADVDHSKVAMGMALCYDALGVSIGQYQLSNKTVGSYGGGGGAGWAQLMGITAAITAAVVGIRYNIDQRFV
jgi:hypothetical protein